MKFFNRFTEFLKEYRIIAISVAFIVGISALGLVQSLVNDIILPIIKPIISGKVATWEDIILPIAGANIRIGSFLSSFISFLIIIVFLYIFVDKILHWKPKKK